MLNQTIAAILLALSVTACVDEQTGSTQVPPAESIAAPLDVRETNPTATTRSDVIEGAAVATDNICAKLPTDDAEPCAHLCDAGGLDPYVPAGTCADFACVLTDGTTVRAGACR